MCSCDASCAGVTCCNVIQKTLLVLGAMMDMIGVFLLAFKSQTIIFGVFFIVIGSTLLTLYLLARVPNVVLYFKKVQSPPRMNRAQDHVTQERRTREDSEDWDDAVYDVPAYEEVAGPMHPQLPSIWTTGDPYDKPPPYSAAIMVSETLGVGGPALPPTASSGGVAQAAAGTPAETFRREPNPVTGPTQVLKVLKPCKLPRLNCSGQVLGGAMEELAQEEPQTPPPSYEDSQDDDVFYTVE